MKLKFFTLILLLLFATTFFSLPIAAQSPWLLPGNTLAGGEKLGSLNSQPVNIVTNNTSRMFINPAGNVGIGITAPTAKLHVIGNQAINGNLAFTNGFNFIQFGNPAVTNNAMMNMFKSGTDNATRMVLAHSPLYQNWGLQYRDSTDRFDFLSNGTSVMLIDLGIKNVGIGTDLPQRKLHVVNGSFGAAAPDANSPFVVENNTDNFISVLAPSSSQRGIYFGDDINVNDGGIIYDGNTNAMLFRTNGNTNRMSVSGTGNVSIGGNIDIAGTTVSFGSVETLADAGANMISSNSDLIPSIDNSRRLGTSTLRWSEVWATDGTINTSDARDKTNVRDLDYGIKEIMKLRSARFNWKNGEDKGEKLGLVAQELQTVLPEVVRSWEYKINEETGAREKVPAARLGVAYSEIIPVLVRGMQEQQLVIDAKDQKITALQTQLKQLQNLLVKKGLVTAGEINNTTNGAFSKARLDQSTPNPARVTTTLRYFIPDDAKSASILITSVNGAVLKSYPVSKMGNGQLTLHLQEFAAGEYIYTLVINGHKFDSKKMIMAK